MCEGKADKMIFSSYTRLTLKVYFKRARFPRQTI